MADTPAKQRQGHGIKLSFYDFGATPFFASQMDQRFSYCLYVPQDYSETEEKRYDLAVIVHGTGRTATWYRDRFAGFRREERLHRPGAALSGRHRRTGRTGQLQAHRIPRHPL